jgi:hypothetical protein
MSRELATGSVEVAIEEAEAVARPADGAAAWEEIPIDPRKSSLDQEKS